METDCSGKGNKFENTQTWQNPERKTDADAWYCSVVEQGQYHKIYFFFKDAINDEEQVGGNKWTDLCLWTSQLYHSN